MVLLYLVLFPVVIKYPNKNNYGERVISAQQFWGRGVMVAGAWEELVTLYLQSEESNTCVLSGAQLDFSIL